MKSKSEIMNRIRKAKRESGLVKVEVWVKKEYAKEIKDLEQEIKKRT
jgi:hypothetical protein